MSHGKLICPVVWYRDTWKLSEFTTIIKLSWWNPDRVTCLVLQTKSWSRLGENKISRNTFMKKPRSKKLGLTFGDDLIIIETRGKQADGRTGRQTYRQAGKKPFFKYYYLKCPYLSNVVSVVRTTFQKNWFNTPPSFEVDRGIWWTLSCWNQLVSWTRVCHQPF